MKSYIPLTPQDKRAMLDHVGAQTVEELFCDIPKSVRLDQAPDIAAHDEVALYAKLRSLAAKNRTGCPSFLGGGAYSHFIPPVVPALANRAEFYTAYTPYQAEMSQGMLQAIFEYQTMLCALTGMDVCNASVYDGATAAAEAMLMARDISKKNTFAVSAAVHPDTLAVLRTYAKATGQQLIEVPADCGKTNKAALAEAMQVAGGFLFAQPNFYGCLEDAPGLHAIAKQSKKAVVVASVDPISLGLLAAPATYADIVVGEGQALGNPVSFGGPYLGFMTTTKKHMRHLPGRIVGESVDAQGNRGFLLTLQAREQHIRRDKATSNICSNQALNALTAAVYLATLGPKGLFQTAQACLEKTVYAADKIAALPGYQLAFDAPFFKEFAVHCPVAPVIINTALRQKGIVGGLDLSPYGRENMLLLAFTETVALEHIDALIATMKEVVQ